MLPSWVAEPARLERSPKMRPSLFLERALRRLADFAANVVFAESVARRPGYLQGLDARVKLWSFLALLAAAAFLQHLASLWLLGACVVAAALYSRIGASELFNRFWWFLPGVFVLVAVPAVLNIITPGEPIVVLLRREASTSLGALVIPNEITITRQGVASAALVVTRMAVGVLVAVTLTLTTRWQDVARAAYTNATAPFVLLLSMTYRYVFVLLRFVEETYVAKRARTVSPTSASAQRRWVGSRIAALFLWSRHLGEQVYLAMLARGYRGTARTLTESKFRAAEALWLLLCSALIVSTLIVDRVVMWGWLW